MKPYLGILFLIFSNSCVASDDIYQQLKHFGEQADQESIVLLEQTAERIGLKDKQFLLFSIRDQFECCGQVFPYTYDDQEYLIVRVWKSLFDELTLGEKRALFGHELMHIKNGDLDRLTRDFWLSSRIFRLYMMGLSAIHGFSGKYLFNPGKALNCMAVGLVVEAIFHEWCYLYEFRKKRVQEMDAELGAARILHSAHDAMSLNNKIASKLVVDRPKRNLLEEWGQHIGEFLSSYYSTHPTREQFNAELKKLISHQNHPRSRLLLP